MEQEKPHNSNRDSNWTLLSASACKKTGISNGWDVQLCWEPWFAGSLFLLLSGPKGGKGSSSLDHTFLQNFRIRCKKFQSFKLRGSKFFYLSNTYYLFKRSQSSWTISLVYFKRKRFIFQNYTECLEMLMVT